jgi:hypothetical protein
MSYENRKHFLDEMGQLSRSELEEVFRILKRHNDNYSENTNGIFFDISIIREDTFIALREFMDFCMKNREEQKARINEMKTIRDECMTNRDIPLQSIKAAGVQ